MTQPYPRVLRGLRIALLFLLSAGPLAGQSPTSGMLTGLVRDTLGIPLPGVNVTVREVQSGISRTLTTSRDGRFRFALLLTGEYQLSAERFGYLPRRVLDIRVRPGVVIDAPLVLERATAEVEEVQTTHFAGTRLAEQRPGVSRWLSDFHLHRMPLENRDLAELGNFSSLSAAGLGSQGLPASMSGVVVDGLPATHLRHPALPNGSPGATLPLSAFQSAELVTNDADVEWSGTGGAILSAHTLRGSREFRFRAFGDWATRDGSPSWAVDPSPGPGERLQAGFLVGFPVIPDTASLVMGIEARRVGPRVYAASAADSMVSYISALAKESFGVALEARSPSSLPPSEAVTGFGRFDWQVTPAHAVALGGSFTLVPSERDAGDVSPLLGGASSFSGRHVTSTATLVSQLSDRVAQEVRLGVESGARDYSPTASAVSENVSEYPSVSTRILADGLRLGREAALSGRYARTAVRLSQTLHLTLGLHRIKAGLSAGYEAHDQTLGAVRAGEFTFGGPGEFVRAEGSFTQTHGPAPTAAFAVPSFGVFAQDTWSPVPGFELLFGLRYDVERLPQEKVRMNQRWLEQTGLGNATFQSVADLVGPRLGFRWDVQNRKRWVVNGTAGIFAGGVDRGILGELLTYDGRVLVRRGFGSLGRWPATPDSGVAPTLGPALALVAPKPKLPRTARASLGIGGLLGRHLALQLFANYRRTDFLSRRRDLNLLPEALGTDQYGRPIFGLLRHSGELLSVENGSNRRFPDFDRVHAVNFDGWSEYRGLTVTLERESAGALNLAASYTYSQTRDNWPGAGAEGFSGNLPPFPDQFFAPDWTEGRSDLDVPHRASVAGEVRLPFLFGASAALLYHFQSGQPFTPGFRDGVDANADGAGHNDPAFVDERLPGMAGLLGAWECLRGQAGLFAARNSCRGADAHALDARFSVGMIQFGRYSAELLLESLNLLATAVPLPDRALYLVDRAGRLQGDLAAGKLTVPLVANPNFGRPIAHLPEPRVVRLGFRMRY